jgi:hypothetical protein
MPQLLVQVVSVNALAAGATVTVAHTLESNGVAVAPTYVVPDRVTSIKVVSVSTTGVTFQNTGLATGSANFRLERGWQPEVDAFTVTPLLWQGGGGGSGTGVGSSVIQIGSLTGITAGLAASTTDYTALPTTFSAPAGTWREGSTVRVRIAGQVNVAALTNFALIVAPAPTPVPATIPATILSSFAKAGLNAGTYPFVIDFTGVFESGATKVHGSAQGTFNAGAESALQPSNGTGFSPTVANVLTTYARFSVANAGNTVDINTIQIDAAL